MSESRFTQERGESLYGGLLISPHFKAPNRLATSVRIAYPWPMTLFRNVNSNSNDSSFRTVRSSCVESLLIATSCKNLDKLPQPAPELIRIGLHTGPDDSIFFRNRLRIGILSGGKSPLNAFPIRHSNHGTLFPDVFLQFLTLHPKCQSCWRTVHEAAIPFYSYSKSLILSVYNATGYI
jgi:hypothetical protein